MGQRMRLDGNNEDFKKDMNTFFEENNITEKDLENFDLDKFLEE